MFAILLSDQMDPFYQNITSFPTVFFTFFLLLSVFYGLFAVLGLLDLSVIDIDVPEAEYSPADGLSAASVLGGLLLRLGLNGVPLPIIVVLISLFGWFLSYYGVYFFIGYDPVAFTKYLFGVPIFFISLFVSAFLTGLILKPLRPVFQAMDQEVEKKVIGRVGVVRTTTVSKTFGEASVEDGGAGLIVKVRSYNDEEFKRGDRVVLLEYVEAEHVYRVISEQEFNA
ncbi:hypothetical protein R50073_42850 [Maricurvus nonylphenolicus]|uniref:DUF1449 domain-containing protein n=1 Tax=Maricurvus nonylphenolicus TaxID=1008307 RepID=UPI0036F3CBB7